MLKIFRLLLIVGMSCSVALVHGVTVENQSKKTVLLEKFYDYDEFELHNKSVRLQDGDFVEEDNILSFCVVVDGKSYQIMCEDGDIIIFTERTGSFGIEKNGKRYSPIM